MEIRHASLIDAAGYVRKAMAQYAEAPVNELPGLAHPMVRTHPETGHDCLYLGRRIKTYVPGLELTESEALLDEIWERAVQPEFQWHHQWKPGDLVMWDNRCTMHRRDAFDPNERRVMHRVMIKGTAPFRARKSSPPHPRGHLRH